MSKHLRWSDSPWLLLIGAWTYVTFVQGGDDFSYDFGNYLGYFERMADLGAEDIWAQLQAFFPYPYILVPPAGFFEIGFVAVVWLLLQAGLSTAAAYATVGAVSVTGRLLLMRAMGLGWPTMLLITIYSVTLFEANAIRLGCSLTLTAMAMLAARRSKPLAALAWILLAGSFHLQSLAFTLPLAIAWAIFPLVDRSRALRALALLLSVLPAAAIALGPGVFDFAKLNEYADTAAGSVGLNAASVSGLLALIIATLAFFTRPAQTETDRGPDARVWSAVHLATLPALMLVLMATSMGPLGDRVWQFAFVAAVVALPMGRNAMVGTKARRWFSLYALALHGCLWVSVINVTIRYPLSNFFAPLIPYTPITPLTLII